MGSTISGSANDLQQANPSQKRVTVGESSCEFEAKPFAEGASRRAHRGIVDATFALKSTKSAQTVLLSSEKDATFFMTLKSQHVSAWLNDLDEVGARRLRLWKASQERQYECVVKIFKDECMKYKSTWEKDAAVLLLADEYATKFNRRMKDLGVKYNILILLFLVDA